MSQPTVSTGRGGAGNIGKDEMTYTDGGVVHESAGDKAGSAGRGGAGNVSASPSASPRVRAADKPSGAAGASGLRQAAIAGEDVVPETNLNDPQPDFHTGRGGAGNEHHERYGGHSTKREQDAAGGEQKSIVGRVKDILGVSK